MKSVAQMNIVDIFAGPGGLGEGFSSVRSDDGCGSRRFKIVASVEQGKHECQTLRLRAFFRLLEDAKDTSSYFDYLKNPTAAMLEELILRHKDAWALADEEVIERTISSDSMDAIISEVKSRINPEEPLVLLGGPPCQAYSLVGRARNAEIIKANGEKWKSDVRRTLYKRYLDFVEMLRPDVFVMENVKGILSASLPNGASVFERVVSDLAHAGTGYSLYSLTTSGDISQLSPRDFVIRSEEYGIPQARHRVIILGVANRIAKIPRILRKRPDQIALEKIIGDLPPLRSSFSLREKKLTNTASEWRRFVTEVHKRYSMKELEDLPHSTGGEWVSYTGKSQELSHWLQPTTMDGVPNHQTRSHISEDIERYIYYALTTDAFSSSPKIHQLPIELLPNHKNLIALKNSKNSHTSEVVKFSDRFRVQRKSEPSRTITSHISKDGHYYIHYDSSQARSLTVREAARIQTFPDNYRFEGPRTSQYHQAGNAVPPYLAYQIAEIVFELIN